MQFYKILFWVFYLSMTLLQKTLWGLRSKRGRLPAGLMVRYTRSEAVTHQPHSLKSVFLLFAVTSSINSSVFAQEELYIIHPHAKLLKKPAFSFEGEPLDRRTKVKVINKEGNFYYVEVNQKKGYVARMFTSPNEPIVQTEKPESRARRRANFDEIGGDWEPNPNYVEIPAYCKDSDREDEYYKYIKSKRKMLSVHTRQETSDTPFYKKLVGFGGIQLGLLNHGQDSSYGLQLGAVNSIREDGYGLQIGLLGNKNEGSFRGLQIGSVSNSNRNGKTDFQFSLFKNNAHSAMVQVSMGNVVDEENRFLQAGFLNLTEKGSSRIQLGIINSANKNRGLQLGILNTSRLDSLFQIGIWNTVARSFTTQKFQAGIFNTSENTILQIGLINSSKKSNIQIGLSNYSKDAWIPWMPFININFKDSK